MIVSVRGNQRIGTKLTAVSIHLNWGQFIDTRFVRNLIFCYLSNIDKCTLLQSGAYIVTTYVFHRKDLVKYMSHTPQRRTYSYDSTYNTDCSYNQQPKDMNICFSYKQITWAQKAPFSALLHGNWNAADVGGKTSKLRLRGGCLPLRHLMNLVSGNFLFHYNIVIF